jgi:hypothetical protein
MVGGMDPLTQDQVEAIERAAADQDDFLATASLARQRRAVADWSIWEAVVVQGLSVRRTARALHLKRGLVRMAIGRVSRELERDPLAPAVVEDLQLYPPRSWEGTAGQ